MQSLMVYSTVDGQTLAICQRIKLHLEQAGQSVKLKDVAQVSLADVNGAEQIIIGASIRYGKHRPALYDFISAHKTSIEGKTNSSYLGCLPARLIIPNTGFSINL